MTEYEPQRRTAHRIHAKRESVMVTDYQIVVDKLKTHGLDAKLESDRLGDFIIVALGGAGGVAIGDLVGDLPYPEFLEGWSATYIGVDGGSCEEPFYRTEDLEVARLVDAVSGFVRWRNRTCLADEVAQLLRQELRSLPGQARTEGDSAGTWVVVSGYSAEEPERLLMVATYPEADMGIGTPAGDPIVGWEVGEHRAGADSVPVYAAPENRDPGPVAVQIGKWIRETAAATHGGERVAVPTAAGPSAD